MHQRTLESGRLGVSCDKLDHVLQDKEGNSQMSEVAKEINIWLKKVMRNSGN
ncbi:hypothetical protein [Pragia fontium]|uniref:hypothetical protein n=1 Tax=Pragia fontium TaxID=82985 RepID=UPI00130E693C|nr:hypothetical protein [Pragia fontium]